MSSSSNSSSSSASSASSTSSSSAGADPCADGKRRIELTPTFQKNFLINATHGFRLRVEVTDYCGFADGKIFRYWRDASGAADRDEFTGVCSWPDLEEYPADEPRADDCPRVFRLDYFDIVVNTESLAHEVWTLVKQEVDQLVETLDEGDVLEAEDAYWAGGAPA